MPDFPIIDAHVHLTDPGRLAYSWMDGAPALKRAWTPQDFTDRTAPAEIGGYVFVEVDVDAGLHLAEAEWVDAVAAADPRLKAQVASVPLELGPAAVERDLERLATLGTVRGVRRLIQDRPDPQFMLRPEFVAAVQLLPRFGFSFDLCIKHPQFAGTIELVRRCPQVSFVLDHPGKPGIAVTLARSVAGAPAPVGGGCPMSCVNCPVSSPRRTTRPRPGPAPADLDHAHRLSSVSSAHVRRRWPVRELAGGRPASRLDVVDRATAGRSVDEKQLLCSAARPYGLHRLAARRRNPRPGTSSS